MRTSVRPVHRALQTYLREAAAKTPFNQAYRQTLCTSCIRTFQANKRRRRSYGIYAATRLEQYHGHGLSRSPKNCSSTIGSVRHSRQLATVSDVPESWGPLAEYDERVHARRLRDDEHQRSMFYKTIMLNTNNLTLSSNRRTSPRST